MEKRYQVFISSTFSDLKEERKEVMEAIISLNCFPAGMEMFPAADMEQFEFIKTIIDQSDYYILIIAGRYGSVAEDGKSYTEKEYEYAREKGKPVLVFVKENIEDLKVSETDNDVDKKEKLVKFRNSVIEKRLAKFWKDKLELKYQVHTSLSTTIRIKPQTGWIKGDSVLEPETVIELEKLKRVNKDLELKIEELKKIESKKKNIENIAQGEDKVEIRYRYTNHLYQVCEEFVEFTWNKVFKLIAPQIGKIQYTTKVKQILDDIIAKEIGREDDDVEVNDIDFNTIKYQFSEIGLLEINYVKGSECIIVTEEGDRVLRELFVIKR